MTENDSHSTIVSVFHRSRTGQFFGARKILSDDPAEKKLPGPIDESGLIQVSQQLYGDAARGCHHRGNGPDASQRTISHNRQRLGDLVIEAPRRSPWGYRGGKCRRVRTSRLTNTSSPPNHGTDRVRITGEGGNESWLLRRRPRRSRLPRRRPRRRSNNFFKPFFVSQ